MLDLTPGTPDAVAAGRLSAEAFGHAVAPVGDTPAPAPPGRHAWGAFVDGAAGGGSELAAKVVARAYDSWWDADTVPTCGIAGVGVAAEHRGAGLLRPLLQRACDQGRDERGESVVTFFPTAPGIYRRLGWEVVGTLLTVEVPVAALAGVRVPEGVGTVALRRATVADVPAVRALYDRWAAARNGPLTRRGVSFPATDAELLADADDHGTPGRIVTLAEDAAGTLVGYASWHRGTGYTRDGTLEVDDLLGVSPGATAALWRMLGSHSSVAGAVRVRTSGVDLARLDLPTLDWTVVEEHPYMLRVHDLPGALAARRLVPADLGDRLDASVHLAVRGDVLGDLDGAWEVGVRGGRGYARRRDAGGDGLPTLTPQGLALLWAGAARTPELRLTGALVGPTDADALLDAWFSRSPVQVRDYF